MRTLHGSQGKAHTYTFYTRLCSFWPESVGFWTGGSIFGLHTFQHFFQFCSKYWTSDCILLLCEACARCISRTPTPTSSVNLRLPTSYKSMSVLPSKCSLEFCFGWKFAIICMQLHLKVNKWTNRVRRKATLAWEKAIEVNNQRSLTLIQKPTGATTGNVGGALHGLWCIPYSGKRSIHDLLKSDMQSCLFVAFLKSIAGMLTTCFTFQTSVSRRALALWWLSCTSEVHHFLQRMCLR